MPTTFMKCGACNATFNTIDLEHHKGVCRAQLPTTLPPLAIGHDQKPPDTGDSQYDPSPTGAVYTPVIPGHYPPASRASPSQRGEASRGALLPPRPAHPPPITPPIYHPRAGQTQTQILNGTPYSPRTHNTAPLTNRMPSKPQLRAVQDPEHSGFLAFAEESMSRRLERGSALTRTSRRAGPPPPLDLSGTQDGSRDEDGISYLASNDDMSSEAEIRAIVTGVRSRKDTQRRQ